MVKIVKIVKKQDNSNERIFYGYYDNGDKFVYHNEDDKPAIIYSDGSKYWYKHDKYHRENGPAIVGADGTEMWYQHGNIHREDGPAAIFKIDGLSTWFIHGVNVENFVIPWMDERNIDPYNMSEEDRLALTFFMRSLC